MKLYQYLFEQSTTPVAVVKADYPLFTFEAVNKAYRDTTGLGDSDVIGVSAFEVFVPQSAADAKQLDGLRSAMTSAVNERKIINLPPMLFEATYKDGFKRGSTWWQVEIQPIFDDLGTLSSLLCVTRNITEQEQGKLDLQRAREKEQRLYGEIASLNEELSTINEELTASLEEVQSANDSLAKSQEELGELNNTLEQRVKQRTNEILILQESEKKQKELLESILINLPAGVAVLSGYDFVLEHVNGKMLEFWGRDDRILNTKLLDFMPELTDQVFPKLLANVLKTGIAYHTTDAPVELVIEGELKTIYMDYSYTPLFNDSGVADRILVLADVVTERTLASLREQTLLKDLADTNTRLSEVNEELTISQENLHRTNIELQASESRFRRMIEQSPVAMSVLMGPGLRVESANEVILKLWGKSNKVIGLPIIQALPEIEGQPFMTLLKNVYDSGEIFFGYEYPAMLEHDGQMVQFYFDFVYQPFYDEKNVVTGILVIASDVTKQVTARKELSNAKDTLDLALNAAELGLFDVDLVNNKMHWNQNCRTHFGINHNRPVSYEHDFVEGLHPDDRHRITQHIDDYVYNEAKSGGSYDVEYRTVGFEDKKVRWVRAKGKTYFDSSGKPLRFLGATLDITEIKLAKIHSDRLAAIITSSDDAIVSKTLESVITSWNAGAERMFGWTADEMIGQTIYKIFPDDRMAEEAMIINKLKSGERVEHFETKRITKDERLIDVSVSVSPIRDGDGNIVGASKIARDITERKQDERRKSDFIGMVSHELKTPLTSLSGILQISEKKLRDSDDVFLSGAMQRANLQVRRMSALINGFLNVSRLESGKMSIDKRRFRLDDLINEVIEETKMTSNSHRINFENCPAVELAADRDKITSVVSNLISNAIKYSPSAGEITLRCHVEDERVVTSVTDRGIGIAATDAGKIFDRYYRVESNDIKHVSGFGIGLYLCAEIIRGHGGEIWLDSTPGMGSTFHFSLPLNTINDK